MHKADKMCLKDNWNVRYSSLVTSLDTQLATQLTRDRIFRMLIASFAVSLPHRIVAVTSISTWRTNCISRVVELSAAFRFAFCSNSESHSSESVDVDRLLFLHPAKMQVMTHSALSANWPFRRSVRWRPLPLAAGLPSSVLPEHWPELALAQE